MVQVVARLGSLGQAWLQRPGVVLAAWLDVTLEALAVDWGETVSLVNGEETPSALAEAARDAERYDRAVRSLSEQ